MKRSPLSALLLCAFAACAPSLLAANFTNGQAARAEFGQYFFNAAQGGPSNQVLAGPQGIAYANGTLYVADGNVLGANDGVDGFGNPVTGNRIVTFFTSELPAPNADLSQGPVSNTLCPVCGFAAINVLGQEDFNSYLPSSYKTSTSQTGSNAGGPAQAGHSDSATGTALNISSMWNPSAVASDGQVLAVADTTNNRVLIWNPLPTTPNAPATLVVGQPNFTTLQSASKTDQTTMRGPQGVWLQNGQLFVADTGNNRVLVWNRIPTTNGQAADYVLGQPNFNQVISPNTTNPVAAANSLWSPTSVTSDGVHLFVADLGFNRVLIWNTIPTQTQQPANVVLGQPNMTAATADNAAGLCPSNGVDTNNKPTYPARCASTLNFPRFVLSDGSRLFVADAGNDRVLIYNQIPTTNGVSADTVLGQPDFASDVAVAQDTSIVSTSVDNTGSSDTVGTPTSLAFDGTNLYVADPFNRRVLVFTPGDLPLAPTATLNAASEARRQEGFVTLTGTVVAKDTVTITINSTNYTYTVVTGDTLDTITANLIKQINSANSNAGDPSVLALSGSIPDTVYLSSKGINLGFDTITLAASSSNTADVNPITNGAYLTGGNAGTVAPGMIAEINYSLTSPTAQGLADSTVSYDPNSVAPFSESGNLPLTLGGVQVFIDGNPVPLFYVSPTQIKCQIPFEYANRSTASLYVRTVHSTGVTTTTAVPLIIAPANPGLFAVPSQSNPRPAYSPQHQSGNPSATFTVGFTSAQAGDVATVTINSRAYTYTVTATDTLATITNGIISAIKDPQVTAASTGATGTVTLTAVQGGAAGSGIPVSVATTPVKGQTAAQISLSSSSSSTCCSDNNTGAITSLNPAQPNETITVYATGLGVIQDSNSNPAAVVDGAPYKGVQPNSAANSVVATVAGGGGTVVNAGLAPGGIGVYAVQIQLPSSLTSNAATPVYIAQNAFISNTVTIPVGTPAGTLATLNATPNPIPVASGQLGVTTLSWNTAATSSVQVRVGSPGGALLATGQGTGSATTGAWVTNGMTFYLQDATNADPGSSAATLATITATLTTASGATGGGSGGGTGTGTGTAAIFPSYCPAADGNVWLANSNVNFSAQPTTIQVPMGTSMGQTTFNWVLPTSVATSANLYVGLGSVQLLSSNVNVGLVQTGGWVTDGMVFWLQSSSNGYDQTTANTLACARVAVQQVSTPVQGRGTLAASPATIITSSTTGQTTLNWTCPTCAFTQVRIGSPSGQLFAANASGGSATTGNWVTDGMTFYLLDTTNASSPSTVAMFTAHLQAPSASAGTSSASSNGVITATPNPAFYAPGSLALAQTSVSWSCSSCSSTEIHVDSPGGPLFATSFGGSGTATTGTWVTDGTVFYLQDASSGNPTSPSSTVSTVTVAVQQSAPVPPSTSNGGTITATPNPILVTNGEGQTTLNWSCSTCTATEVHVNAPNGPLVSAYAVGSGSVTTGYWVTYGTVFYLQDASNGNAGDPSNTKATVTVWTQSQ